MILASQFRSFLQPLALMSSLPLTLIGVVLALLMFRSTLNMFSIIGIVMLMGLVTKNAILLIDFAIRAQRGERRPREARRQRRARSAPMVSREASALLYAAEVRLRPILMTTLAMVFGMVPLAFALSEGSEQRAPMGQAVIGGVITSSLLTLVVVPVVYCYLDDLARWAGRLVRRAPAPAVPAGSRVGCTPPLPSRPAMNIEQARFNMIEQQIRPWEVLDQSVLALLSVVKREDFVPPTYRAMAFVDTQVPLPAGQSMLEPKVEARMLQELAVHTPRARARDRRRLGLHGGAAGAQGAARDDARDRAGAGAAGRRQPAARLGRRTRPWSRPTPRSRLPADGPFDVIVLSGSVAEVPRALLAQLKPGGRLAAIVGQLPVMRAVLMTRGAEAGHATVELFDTVAPRLCGFGEPSRFTF